MLDTLLAMIFLSLAISSPIIIAGLGGIFSERAGIVNIALEGIMMVGACAAATAQVSMSNPNGWVSLSIGVIAGLIYSILHAIATVNFKADHVISGTALNIMAGGITVYFTEVMFGQRRTPEMKTVFDKIKIPFLTDKFSSVTIYPTFFLVILLVIVTHFVLKYTKYGLRLRSCGEFPQASDSVGINVYLYRYSGILISGGLAGLAGAIKVLTLDTQFTLSTIGGAGFIALAAVIFGRWDARGVLAAGLFFGFSTVIGVYSKDIPIISSWPTEIFNAVPYILTIVILVITSSKVTGPKAAGEIYDKGKR